MPLLPVYLALALCGGRPAWPDTADLLSSLSLAVLVSSAVGATVGAPACAARVVFACGLAGVWAAGDGAGRARRRPSPCAAPSGAARPGHARRCVELSGVLDEDASAGANGVRLRLAVHRFAGQEVDGAETVALTVGGTLAEPRMAQWRAGRAIRAVATLRRPAHYLNPGVGDDRLALARRGLTLVGSVKSGTLVEVQAPGTWRQERAADLRAHVRARPGDACAATRPDGRRHRYGHSHRRPRPGSIPRSKSDCRSPAPITSSRSREATSPCSR